MHTGKLVFAQLMEHLPLTTFRRSVARYRGHHVKWHEINVLDELITEPGAFYVMDRGYIDFERLGRLNEAGSFFLYRNFKPPFFLARAISPDRWDVNRLSV
jgi:hypothetical protein